MSNANETTYADAARIRDTEVDGISNWVWPKVDDGAWIGPVNDWVTSHAERYYKYLKITDVVFCAGGNCGLYTRLFAKRFACVYSFEPDPMNFHCLVNNNQLPNVFKYQAALGSSHTMIQMQELDPANVGMHKVAEGLRGLTPVLKLDDFKPSTVDLIQLDVEGYEYNVLLGGLNMIGTFKPVISCERGNDQILHLLKQFGYSVVDQSVADTIYAVS